MVEITKIGGSLVEPQKAPAAPPVNNPKKVSEPGKSTRVEYNTASVKGSATKITVKTPGARVSVQAPQSKTHFLAGIAKDANNDLHIINSNLAIEVDEELKQVIFKVVDVETGETIKQIPSKEMIEIAKRLKLMIEDYSNRKASNRRVFMDSGSFA